MKKWLNEYKTLINGRTATCPKCGGHNLDYGYEKLKSDSSSGFGAVWCEDCRSAFILCRVLLTSESVRGKIMPVLPKDLRFV